MGCYDRCSCVNKGKKNAKKYCINYNSNKKRNNTPSFGDDFSANKKNCAARRGNSIGFYSIFNKSLGMQLKAKNSEKLISDRRETH